MKTKMIALRLEEGLYNKIQSVCEKDNLMISEAIRNALRQVFSEVSKEIPKEIPKEINTAHITKSPKKEIIPELQLGESKHIWGEGDSVAKCYLCGKVDRYRNTTIKKRKVDGKYYCSVCYKQVARQD